MQINTATRRKEILLQKDLFHRPHELAFLSLLSKQKRYSRSDNRANEALVFLNEIQHVRRDKKTPAAVEVIPLDLCPQKKKHNKTGRQGTPRADRGRSTTQ